MKKYEGWGFVKINYEVLIKLQSEECLKLFSNWCLAMSLKNVNLANSIGNESKTSNKKLNYLKERKEKYGNN